MLIHGCALVRDGARVRRSDRQGSEAPADPFALREGPHSRKDEERHADEDGHADQ